MPYDKTTITNLQTTCGLLAHLAGQYQVDVPQLKAMDMDWLAKRVKCWYRLSEKQLRTVIKRLLYLGEDPVYDAGKVEGAQTVSQVLERAEKNVSSALDQVVDFRKQSWDARADYTPDIFEHVVRDLEGQLFKIQRELKVLGSLGEPEYIAARLEDGD